MDSKNDRKKESIDEILSDLNGLLNKMPSILDGIRMPELPPAELSPAPEPRTPRPEVPADLPAAPVDADKTVVLESFSGLAEGSQVPAEIPSFRSPEPASPQPEAASAEEEKAAVPEPFFMSQEGAAAPERLEPAPQSPADLLPEAETQPEPEKPAPAGLAGLSGAPLEPPQEKPVRNPGRGPSLSVSELTPPAAEPQAAPAQTSFSLETPAVPPADEDASEKRAEVTAFGNTSDFGIPDIDALIQMSEGRGAVSEQEQPALTPPDMEPVQAAAEENAASSIPASAGSEPQLPAAVFDGDIMDLNEPEEGKNEIPQPEAGVSASSPAPEEQVAEPEAKPETSFEAFTIEPSPSDPVAAQDGGESFPEPASGLQPEPDGGETLRLEPAPESMAGAALEPQPAEPPDIPAAFAEPAAASGEIGPGVQSGPSEEPAAAPEPETGPGVQVSGTEPAPVSGIELAPAVELGGDGSAPAVDPDETLPGGRGMELGGPASPSLSGDETLVVAPPAGTSGEEEKTVIFQAAPTTTSRAQAGDLSSLTALQTPEGIPAERVRSLVFLYSPGDEALCATVLAELDAVCLKSAAKPMFIKRAYVKEFDPDSNANFIHQSFIDSGATGLVCLGAVPQEKVYELENVFSSSGGFFRYYEASSFSHSASLDLVTDLIVR